jgi:hypothetical protein
MLLASCESTGGSVTERTICDELRRDLPSWSTQDTAQSQREGARFITVFEAVCR